MISSAGRALERRPFRPVRQVRGRTGASGAVVVPIRLLGQFREYSVGQFRWTLRFGDNSDSLATGLQQHDPQHLAA